MDKSFKENFKNSILTGFIDKSLNSDSLYQPELLVNTKIPRKKVLSTIINELENCESFYISVAFVTTGGVATLINTLDNLEKKGIKGKILVSQYLNFTQPEALKRLYQFKNIELRIVIKENSHSKGYIFKNSNYYNLIIGSSNLTSSALSTNKEWNMKVSARNTSSIVDKVINEFHSDFKIGKIVDSDYIEKYAKIYKKQSLIYKKEEAEISQEIEIVPNSMQVEALNNLKKLREEHDKALVISATGTGKTYLAAFDAKSFNPKKLLFVVHRLTIAQKAMKTFQSVFGDTKTMGIYSGRQLELNKDFVFSTVQTISKRNHLEQFEKNYFDYIIIDESHRSGAQSYIRLINFFKPKFLLGMTATPDRTDGSEIYALFDHNIAYEIRLNRAMEEDMLIPFHYYGVADLSVNGKILENESDFKLLTAYERVTKIIEKIEFYGSDNGITRGLIFCSRNNEANELSKKFNEKGFRTIALTGNNTEEERGNAIELLESDSLQNKLDYIFTVDIFNEGIDIPRVNQVIMIRPTQSAIVFIQQLGRGLRKTDDKHYLTVIDFIGNYKNNFLIPIALYGDTSYNKDSIRKLISEGSRMIPGESTINFDQITKEKIYESIDSTNMQLLADLKKDYTNLKNRIGRIPMMMDFVNNKARDPFAFVQYKKNSYYHFVCRIENDLIPELTSSEKELLILFSNEINNSKRIEESIILKELILNKSLTIDYLREIIITKYGYKVSLETIESCVNNLNFKFVNKEKNIIVLKEMFKFHTEFLIHLKNQNFKTFLLDNINYAISKFDEKFSFGKYIDGFLLYEKYGRKDVCRILNWDKNYESTVYGYKIKNELSPLFVTYKKSEEISSTTKYNDHFVNQNEFAWESKSNRTLKSKEIQKLANSNITNLKIFLFIQKSNNEGNDFYFFGDLEVIADSIKQDTKNDDKNNKRVPVVHFNFRLKHTVIDSIYRYITEDESIKKTAFSAPQRNIQLKSDSDEEEVKKTNFKIPLYNFYAAAGTFSEMQSEKEYSLVNVSEKYVSQDYFACRVIGESMNRIIPNNSICIFKKYFGGSRDGKILLVENRDTYDPDFNSAFTVKTYSSEKIINEEGWRHTSIVLKPNSFDKRYKNIVINQHNSQEMRIIGEFITLIT